MKEKIVLISGKMGSGKSTLAKALQAMVDNDTQSRSYAKLIRFAKPLYEMHDAVLAIAKQYGIRVTHKDGALLQLLGTDWARNTKGEDVWVHALMSYVEKNSSPNTIFIVEDCRFKNELYSFPDAFKIRIEASESARKPRADSWRENTTHQSETDLDDVPRNHFSLLLDSENYSKETNAILAYETMKNFWENIRL